LDFDNRKELRYRLRLPVQMILANAVEERRDGFTENISAHGILLRTEGRIPENTRLRLAIDVRLPTRDGRLVGSGVVVRVEPAREKGFLIAVRCVRPFNIREAESQEGK